MARCEGFNKRIEGRWRSIECISSHSWAKELLNRPNCFLTAMIDDKEYEIRSIKPIRSHANSDDGSVYYTLMLEVDGTVMDYKAASSWIMNY